MSSKSQETGADSSNGGNFQQGQLLINGNENNKENRSIPTTGLSTSISNHIYSTISSDSSEFCPVENVSSLWVDDSNSDDRQMSPLCADTPSNSMTIRIAECTRLVSPHTTRSTPDVVYHHGAIEPCISEVAVEDMEINPTEVRICNSNETTSSTNSIICRICQLNEKESGEPLEDTGCECRGTMGHCHFKCMEEWTRRRRTNMCELCEKPTKYETPPPDEEIMYPRMCNNNRRVWFSLIFSLLLFCTFASGALIVYVKDDYSSAMKDSLEAGYSDLPDELREHYHLAFSLSLSFVVFCATMTIGFVGIWLVAEVYLWPHESRIQQQLEGFTSVDIDQSAEGLELETVT